MLSQGRLLVHRSHALRRVEVLLAVSHWFFFRNSFVTLGERLDSPQLMSGLEFILGDEVISCKSLVDPHRQLRVVQLVR
jgi:hypothetical protein